MLFREKNKDPDPSSYTEQELEKMREIYNAFAKKDSQKITRDDTIKILNSLKRETSEG